MMTITAITPKIIIILIVPGSAGGGVAIGVEVGLGVRVGLDGSGVSVGGAIVATISKVGVEVGFTWVCVGPSTGVIKTFLGSWLESPGLCKAQGTNVLRIINRVKRWIFIWFIE